MTATLNMVVSINSTTVMQTYWTTPFKMRCLHQVRCNPATDYGLLDSYESVQETAVLLIKHYESSIINSLHFQAILQYI